MTLRVRLVERAKTCRGTSSVTAQPTTQANTAQVGIYTTIGGVSAKICPPNVTNF